MSNIFKRQMTRRDFLWLISASTASTITGTQLTGCAADPVTGQQRLMLMSEAQEIAIDQQHAPHQFSNDYGIVQDAPINRYVSEVGGGIGRISHRPQMPYNFQVVNANYINAYTFPGGSMACTRGIMVEMEDEASLAALLGHETGHVNARHTARRQTQAVLASVALGGIAIAATRSDRLPGGDQLVYAIGALGAGALLAHYSRENEREADSLGLEYMVKADHNPQGMVDLMAMLQTESRRQPNTLEMMFSTHPMSQERFATAQRESREKYGQSMDRKTGRERYMDNTASLRRIKPAIKTMQEGEAQMAKKEYAKAEGSFNTALRQVPTDYCGLVLMAKCQLAQERPREAAAYLEQARASYPEEGQALHLSGITQLALNRPDAAVAAFQDYEQRLPGNPNTQFLLGVSYENMQNRPAAARHYQNYLQQARDTAQSRYALSRLQAWSQ
ncbi:MAG: M48 family metalloprotease [Chromatiales bacterium]|nr:M48 family metalloprotease [Gammaproteobacteria bacterium]MBW6476706.1 M48 family metalloprotease [Chromatiales bacterium]